MFVLLLYLNKSELMCWIIFYSYILFVSIILVVICINKSFIYFFYLQLAKEIGLQEEEKALQ